MVFGDEGAKNLIWLCWRRWGDREYP